MEGNITIVRYSSSDKMEIQVEDKLSRTRFLMVNISANDLMLALTGQGNIPIKFEINVDYVGKKAEHKTEWVPVPQYTLSRQEIDKALAPFEQDGWLAERVDMVNHHRHQGNDTEGHQYQVSFTRYVEP